MSAADPGPEAAEPRPIAVFAYGSLVAPESLSQTLGRPPGRAGAAVEQRSAALRGWRRRWSLVRDNRSCEKTFARDDDGSLPAHVLSLNIERTGDPADAVNGLAVALTETELARLDLRELRYDRCDATAEVELAGAGATFVRIHAYTAKPANFAPEPPPGAVILRSYALGVERAFTRLGGGELDRYRRTTGPYPVELIDAHLVGDRIPPGNPRTW